MAAGQQKKRLITPSFVSCNLQEQYKAKKKKNLESSQNVLNMRSHISLEWDDTQKRAVAKREQIGMTVRDIVPFVDSIPWPNTGLADVIPIPQEILGLENLTGVLSYEIWKTHLSESERKLLTQFLPRGADVDHVVQELLTGNNFHFGNPFLKWGALLCSGDLHPDAVLRREKNFKANKKAYYSELQKYHNDVVENLQNWKNIWISCKDPEEDIIEKMWRCPRKHAQNSPLSHANDSRLYDLEENLAATADSSSGAADEKVCFANKEIALAKKGGDPHQRKGLGKLKNGSLLVPPASAKVLTNSRKEEIPCKILIRSGDAAKYMSYFKISRKQHELVKRIKQCSDGIQSKSLNRVLGDMKSFHVRPYETFEEEEMKKLHDHWLQLASRDLPAAFAHRKDIQLRRQQWRKSLDKEIAETKKPLMDEDEEKRNPEPSLQEQFDSVETEHDATIDVKNQDDGDSASNCAHIQSLQRIPSLNSHHEVEPMRNEVEPMILDSDEGNKEMLKQDGIAPVISQFLENMNPTDDVVERKPSIASAKHVWSSVGMPDPYYHPTLVSHGYTSAGDLSLRKLKSMEERSSHLIDLETDIFKQETGESFLQGSPEKVGSALHINNEASLLRYTNQNHNEQLLPPFLKGQGMLPSYPQEHMNGPKQPGLQLLKPADGSRENCHFTWEKEVYMPQIMQQNMYSNGRYPIQQLISPVNSHDWPTDSLPLPPPFQSPTNGTLLGQNWFCGEPRIHNGCSGVEVSSTASQCLGDVNNTDESLFSVLSQCNKLQFGSPYGTMNSNQYVPVRTITGGNISGNGDALMYSPHQLNYLNGRETASGGPTMKVNSTSWMNIPHPNSNLHNPMGRPFLRPWNQ
ncbi:nuclear factor kappa-B-binding protein [Tasmannia lanceolata]|uniref:nuclear factor kappa-B-binding protein n=1 Tax=Tasmannia lanceolata TaxID=3420 RepID=UPI004063A248